MSTKPPPLPPETRTVGQLVAESIKLYGDNLWASLALGLSVTVINQISAGHSTTFQVLVLAAGAPLMAASYAFASTIVGGVERRAADLGRAIVVGAIVFVPAAFLSLLYVLPAVAWLALVGLVVPVLVLERLAVGAALRRAVELARADYVHALGSLATLTILFGLVKLSLALLLRDFGESGERAALGLADLVVSPLLFLGAALLYVDQAARVAAARDRPRGAGDKLAPRPRGGRMPTYLMLTTLTPQGVQTLKANPSRLREVNADVEELGAKVLHQWATLGEYDFVNIVEAADAATVAKVSLALGARGSAKLQSLELVEIDTLLSTFEA